MRLRAIEIARATDGTLLPGRGPNDPVATSYAIDSRLVEPGACFFALRADRDGHAFVADAVARGARVAVVDTAPAQPVDAAIVTVVDPMAALQTLAATARDRLAGAVVGITGSAGKTATKDLSAAAVAAGRRVHASPGSFNNEAGVPLTLLGAADDTEVVVAEMGARFAGNIADLTVFARPTIGVVTNIGLAHAGHLGGPEGIARVKGELIESLPSDGLAVLNADCEWTEELAARTDARVLRVGTGTGADVRVSVLGLDDELCPTVELSTPWGDARVALRLRGAHQAGNAAMAVTVAASLGVPVERAAAALAGVVAAAHRMELVRTASGVAVLNDAYNSSPTAADAALRALAALSVDGRRLAVLGEMLELGEHADEEHEALGRLAADLGLDAVLAVGEHADAIVRGAGPRLSARVVPDASAAAVAVRDEVRAGDAVLVKASRAIGLEVVIEALAAGSDRP